MNNCGMEVHLKELVC